MICQISAPENGEKIRKLQIYGIKTDILLEKGVNLVYLIRILFLFGDFITVIAP